MPSAPPTTAGIKPGAEPIDLQEGNSNGILLLHGFGDTPQTLDLLARHLHTSGFDVKVPLLPGHGRNVHAFIESRRSEWLACARQELMLMKASHRSMSIGGLSMGGALAAILAAESRELNSLVLIAPYLDMPVTHRVAAGLHWVWGPIAGAQRSSSPRSIMDPEERKKNLGYGAYSARLLYELWRLAAQARRALPSITTPTLVIQSKADPRIAASIAERAIALLGAKEKKLCWVEGGHIITVDFDREKVFDEVTDWVKRHTP